MKVSMNGLRRNLSMEFNLVVTAFNLGDMEEIRNSLENMRSYLNALNSVYSEDGDKDFTDIYEQVQLRHVQGGDDGR